MTRSFVLFLLVALLTPAVALPQCDFRLLYSDNFRVSAFDVALENADLYVATGYGVTLYDSAVDPAAPVSSVAVPGVTREVQPAGDLVYAGSGTAVHVIRRSGRNLQYVRAVDLGATVNDLLLVGTYLYAATSTGVVQVDLLSRENPVVLRRLTTTSGSSFSLAVSGATLYAADGDSSIEMYSIQIPAIAQRIGEVSTAGPVSTVAVSSNRLFASGGTAIEIFTTDATPVRIGTASAFGGTALLPYSGNVIFTSGTDRRVRASDLSQPATPVILFDLELPASGGTVNRVEALATVGGRVYAAAGDLGLLTFDARGLVEPLAVRHLVTSSARSVLARDGNIIVAGDSTGIRQYNQSATGVLTLARNWDNTRVSAVLDGTATRLLTASGSTLTLWDTAPAIPTILSNATLAGTVRSAVIVNQIAHAILVDRTLWRVALAQMTGSVSQVNGSGAPSFITRAGGALATAELSDEGTTAIRYFPSGDLGSPPLTASLEGSATSGIALSESGIVAAVTFRGLNLVDFRSGTPAISVLAGSSAIPARDLEIAGSDLIVASATTLEVWDLQTRSLRRRFFLPDSVNALSAIASGSRLISLATPSGITTVNYLTTSAPPELLPSTARNRYFNRFYNSGSRGHLYDGISLQSFRFDELGRPIIPRNVIVPPGTVDTAVIADTIYSLTGSGRIVARDINSGAQTGEFQINEGLDTSGLTMRAIGSTLHASISKGCLIGVCEKKTLVIQPTAGGLVQTSSLSGAIVDHVVASNRIYALFDSPAEIRVLDTTNSAVPVILASTATKGNPVAIAHSATQHHVYTLGSRVYVYGEIRLEEAGEFLEPFVADAEGRFNYAQQDIAATGDCVLVSGRSVKPQLFAISAPQPSLRVWTPVLSPEVPGPVRSVFGLGQNFYLLTDYSLEIWTSGPTGQPRHRIRR